MANTYVQQRAHLVWSTRNRQHFLSPSIRPALWPYLGGIIRNHGGHMLAAGGIDDHIHIYTDYPKTTSLSQFVNTIKSVSSKWLRETYPSLAGFRWQTGYSAFSVTGRGDQALIAYIANQERHHRTRSFEEEYLHFLEIHKVTYDHRYVFAE